MRGKTLEELTGEQVDIAPLTSMIRRVAKAWRTPIEHLSCEQLRLLVGQDMGTPWLASLALEIATRWPNAEVTFYPGDLAHVMLRNFGSIFAADPASARTMLGGDFGWIARLRETDRDFGTSTADESERLLAEARCIAA